MTQPREIDLSSSPSLATVAAAAPAGDATSVFCGHCGAQKAPSARFCPSCGKPEAGAGAASLSGDRMGRIGKDVLTVLRSLARDPVGGLRHAYGRIDHGEAWWTTGALLLAGLLLAVVGVTIGAGRLSGGFVQVRVPFFATFLSLLATPLVLAGGSYGLRRLTVPGPHTPQADLFTAAAALLPVGLATFLAGLLGAGNAEIAFLLLFFGGILAVLMVFAGWTTLGGMTPRLAAWLLPLVLAVALWAAKVILFALAGP